MTWHLGAAVTAFIDGELDHPRRDEVSEHLAHCAGCRLEVEAQLRLKAALRAAALSPAVPTGLTIRVIASTAPLGPALPGRRRSRLLLTPRSRVRRAALGGTLVVVTFGGAVVLAGPAPAPVAPVNPTNPRFLVDHVSTSGEVPFADANVVPVAATSAP